MSGAIATAHPNIALVKYWGKRDISLNLPAVSSLSLTLGGWVTRTEVRPGAQEDEVWLNGDRITGKFATKVGLHLDRLDPRRPPCVVRTENSFPSGAGLASSASGFAALTLAGAHALGIADRSPEALSALARRGSGSACRSLFGGLVTWRKGSRADGLDSVARPIAGTESWDLRMVMAVVHEGQKPVGSTEGMLRSAQTSPLWQSWLDQAEADVDQAEAAVAARDLQALGEVMERSTFKMHATMHSATPPLLYWKPATVACIQAVLALREAGTPAYLTMDAGPQVKVLCTPAHAEQVAAALAPHALRTEILAPGGPARLLS